MTDTQPVVRRVSSQIVYRNRWMTVREDQIEYPDGSPGLYGYVVRPDFVLVIPQEGDGFHIVEEYRYPIGRRSWSFPQGTAEAATSEDMAHRELREETGLRAAHLRHLGRLDNAHGMTDQALDVYLATGLTEGGSEREHSEQDMRQRWVSRAEFERMMLDGSITDSSSVAAYTLWVLRGHG
ncbi:ADP-ribose pyrophosphatase [Sphaerisporangium melleum]|uniref:ADP-ribose pyrophosphatase n=1 Tax=Sphaerisporangium melleum TaxID=321316 RepID=A0A917R6G1_9ACTN|nr:NUDIX hydrolase [Sphaerisporangium melleum]GGK92734.1 ADP-ribose pyrophosphatase [Sphaerisporangium melleum]GII73048.1 ADP-ribose pyrophosphatase [Sphaerisporangium melleum]